MTGLFVEIVIPKLDAFSFLFYHEFVDSLGTRGLYDDRVDLSYVYCEITLVEYLRKSKRDVPPGTF